MYPQLAIRERFNIDQKNYSMASRLIKDAIIEGVIKEADTESPLDSAYRDHGETLEK